MMDLYELNPHLEYIVKNTGYKTTKSLMFLYWLVHNIKPESVLELGTGGGCSAIFMALGNKKTVVSSIDNYLQDINFNDIEKAENAIKLCGLQDNIGLIQADTRTKIKDGWNDKFEIVFMDASHNDADMLSEYNAIYDSLKKDHIIVVDDLDSIYEGKSTVRTFFNVLSKNYEFSLLLNFHNGLGVLMTSLNKYLDRVYDATWRANN